MSAQQKYILPPQVVYRSHREDPYSKEVTDLIVPWDGKEEMDAGLLMVPFSRLDPKGTNASAGGPNAVRLAFAAHRTYSADFDVDLKDLLVRDIGDVRLHAADLRRSYANIEEAVVELYDTTGHVIPIIIGGDHSVTCPLVQGYCRAHPNERVGIVVFDGHFDVRHFEDDWPISGSPFRGILEGPANVQGRNIVEIGIHGFMNSSYYKAYCEKQGISIISARQIRRRGIEDIIKEAVRIASDKTDSIYVSLDIDCLAKAYAPGTGNASPEGMEAWDLLEAMFVLGKDPRVKALDIVEIDPFRDTGDATARMGVSIILTFLGGLVVRKKTG